MEAPHPHVSLREPELERPVASIEDRDVMAVAAHVALLADDIIGAGAQILERLPASRRR